MADKKYIIMWNSGYGETYEVIVAPSDKAALDEAYERWLEEAESNADYSAEAFTPKLAEEYGINDETSEETV